MRDVRSVIVVRRKSHPEAPADEEPSPQTEDVSHKHSSTAPVTSPV